MKKAIIILTVFLCSQTIDGQILNGSFENDSGPDLSKWETRCYDPESVSSAPPDGGNWSIKVLGGNFEDCFPGYAFQKLPTITNGQAFLLTGWARGETAQLYIGKINNGEITLETGSDFSSNSWTQLSIQSSFSISSEDTAIVVLHMGTIGGGESLFGFFDLIKLELVPGINNPEHKKSLLLLPNPFKNQTMLKTDKVMRNAILTMKNKYGQIVKQMENIVGQTIILKRDGLSSGLYFIHLSENNKTIASEKLIIVD